MTPPPATAPAIVWAVYLGCTTAARLARERGTNRWDACRALSQAVRDGHLERARHGVYRLPLEYGVPFAEAWMSRSTINHARSAS